MNTQIAELEGLIEGFIDRYKPSPLWVPVSGGKDSAAVWGLVSRVTSDYAVVYIQIPGQTHMDNVRSVLETARILGVKSQRTVRVDKTRLIREKLESALRECQRPCLLRVVAFDTHGRDFWAAMSQYGFPAPLGRFGRGTRWCCGVFKHRVLQRLPYNGCRNGRPWKYGVNGVKATDSPYRRKRYTSHEQTWEKTRDTYLFPLLNLTDKQVWQLLDRLNLTRAVAPQYNAWGRSPNCMWCPLIGKTRAARTAQAIPPGMRALITRHLLGLRDRYKEGTYSREKIDQWLQILSVPEAKHSPHQASQ